MYAMMWNCISTAKTADNITHHHIMKPLTNIAQIKNRITKLNAKTPAKPLKGHGFDRVECTLPLVFQLLTKHAPFHCAVVSNREPINRFGKLGFVGHHYISPELAEIVKANAADFETLEKSLNTVAQFGL